jgi:hypothetical protein
MNAVTVNPLELLTWWEGRGGRRPASLREIAARLGISEATVRKRIQTLRAAGQVDDEARRQALATRGGLRRGGRPAHFREILANPATPSEVPVHKPDNSKIEPVFTTADAAPLLGIKPGTLTIWRYQGVGPRFVKCGSRVVYRLRDLNDYLDRRTRKSTADPGPEEK